MLAFLVIAYFSFKGMASWRQGYSWNEMDWSQKGSTSIADFFAASDIGKKDVQINGILCVEYYSYKDGLPVKQVCPK
ncbi:hypothetical protein AR540_06900 [Pseudomonas sp. EpS/L25]|nr:hypothetical protein AR540_06900 [Pseudomonas sp. EpS/L25]